MVEVNVQLFVGAAVTVFLALMFFGVVVLWDVALALRSVGDKIDKLEDNIDDDLTDIGHTLDGISGAPGGGGTQLHLSGGTISSGPAPGGAQGQPTQGAQPQQQGAQAQHSPGPQPQQAGAAGTDVAGGERGPQQPPRGQEDAGIAEADAGDERDADESEPGTPPEEPADVEPTIEDDVPTESEEPSPSDSESEGRTEPAHPRAERNRGRFVTSPDRTAWYATALDRDAIRAARPSIAGELTDGSESEIDESEIIAAGPVESAVAAGAVETSDTTDTDDPDGDTADAAGTTAPASDGTDAHPLSGDESAGSEAGGETDPAADPDDEGSAFDADGSEEAAPESGNDAVEESDDADVLTFDETDLDDGSSAEQPSESDDRTETDASDSEIEEGTFEIDPVDESSVRSDADDAESEESTTDLEPVDDETEALERDESDDGEPSAESDEAESADAEQTLAEEMTAFEFDHETDEEDDVSVEEAVDTINEDAPAPELSSHQFDLRAEVHESEGDDGEAESAVLTFEFDTDTVDISGSTRRLLQYQMRSYADRESTPDGTVSIGRDRIVIEIPDSDGNAVQRWGEAAVSIIDRTLYLSDNSSEDN